MMKFALFLVCALVAVQGFQARSVESNDRALSDIIDKIKAVIEKIKQVIGEITSQIPELIQNIKDKIKEIAGKIPDLINGIKQKIEEIIQAAGEIGRKCVDAQKPNIDALIEFAQSGLQACAEEADGKTAALAKQIEVLVEKANALREDIVNRALKCVDENKLNPVGLVNCLKSQVEPITEEVEALQKEIVNTINIAKQTAEEVGASLAECVVEVEKKIAAQEQKILQDIRDCIKENTA